VIGVKNYQNDGVSDLGGSFIWVSIYNGYELWLRVIGVREL